MPSGGLDIGIERAGFESLWFCENDKSCRKVLAERWPDVPVIGNIIDVGEAEAAVRPDLVVGGFPCGDLSYAGKRAGLEGDRSGLWVEMARVIRLLKSRMVLVENVPGLMRPVAGGSGVAPIGVVLADLAELGYDARWGRLQAADVGAPHLRSRVFIIAWLRSAANAIGNGRERGGDPRGKKGERSGGGTSSGSAETTSFAGGNGSQGGSLGGGLGHGQEGSSSRIGVARVDESIAHTRCGRFARDTRTAPSEKEQGWIQPNDGDVSGDSGQDASDAEPGGCVRGNQGVDWGVFEPAIRRWELLLTRSAPRPADDRGRLNVRLCEWMLGFPEGWVDVKGVSRTAQIRMLGNAVQVQCGEAIGYHIMDQLEKLSR